MNIDIYIYLKNIRLINFEIYRYIFLNKFKKYYLILGNFEKKKYDLIFIFYYFYIVGLNIEDFIYFFNIFGFIMELIIFDILLVGLLYCNLEGKVWYFKYTIYMLIWQLAHFFI